MPRSELHPNNICQSLTLGKLRHCEKVLSIFSHVLVGDMLVSSSDCHLAVNLQCYALVAAGGDSRHSYKASGARGDRPGLKAYLDYLKATC